ncbi:MAG TPA: hypothetical protein VFB79_15055 [Candidatus Angelobacter sp.]|nr:hypothetical protein [Candidatus Angelobacter sp.]
MRLVENLRKAEEKGVMSIRRGMERAREEWSDVERRIRQRMRIYPQKQQSMAAAIPVSPMSMDPEITERQMSSAERRTPIVSIHGRDMKDL